MWSQGSDLCSVEFRSPPSVSSAAEGRNRGMENDNEEKKNNKEATGII